MSDRPDVARLLSDLASGRREAFDELMPVVYDELRGLAHALLIGERPGHTLNTTALVHEAYLRLVQVQRMDWKDRSHFLSMAARAMRRVLVDYAKARNRLKRGAGQNVEVPIEAAVGVSVGSLDDVLRLEDALAGLEQLNERHGRLVELRVFAGMTIDETAQALGISPATVKRDWRFCRAYLNRELVAADTSILEEPDQ